MKNFGLKFKKIIGWFKKHKLITIFLIIAIGVGSYYYWQSKKASVVVTKYVMTNVEKGTIMSTVSGSGQISSSNQIDIKPKVSADIKSVKVKAGDKVNEGDVLAVLDDHDLKKSLRQAANSVSSAKASLDVKLAGPTNEEVELSQNSVNSAKNSYDSSLVDLENVKATNEQNLKKAQLQLDNAKISLDNAQRSYDNSVSSQGVSINSNDQSLNSAYDSANISANSAYVSMSSLMSAADNVLAIDNQDNMKSYSYLYGVKNSQTVLDAKTYYSEAKVKMAEFEKLLNSSDTANIDQTLLKGLDALKSAKSLSHSLYNVFLNTIISSELSQSALDSLKQSAISNESSMVSNINSIQSAIQKISDAKLSKTSGSLSSDNSVGSSYSSLNTAKNNYISAQNSLEQANLDAKKSLESAQNDVKAKKLSYENSLISHNQKIATPRAIDLANLKLQLQQAQNNYADALDDLNEVKIISPIKGTVAKVYQKANEQASSGTTIVTVVTDEQMAVISLNEVDAAKVKVGQKANVTFSALDELNITGSVAEVDSIGTVSQGVVNYEVKISLDVQDENIKPQMSVSAIIVTDQRNDVLVVPNEAVKTDSVSQLSYVEVFSGQTLAINENGVEVNAKPEKKYIQIGLADDTNTEITGGLTEGEQIVSKTLTSSSKTSSSATSNSSLRMLGGGGMPGGGR
ncbi:MAG: HlyD family efflux transporter periplasmic adaptor subunit [Patescibacteria group bacterium]|nr:HlyD family efflux transporter periplasmic adaptor subunit [Patescibacteria group bacterium]